MREKKRRKERPLAPTTREPRAIRIAEWIALVGVYGALLTPLVYTRATMFPFAYPKTLFFQAVVDIAFPAWVALAVRDRKYRPQPSGLLGSMLAWLLATTLATCFAENPWRSLFSYPERMTGLLSQAHVAGWFVMASGMLKGPQRWRALLKVHLAVAFVCAAVAALQLAVPDLLGAAPVGRGERLMSLLGNPIYLGSYEAFSVFFAMVLLRDARPARGGLYLLAALAAICAMAFAGSRGPILGLVVGIAVAILVLGMLGQRRRLATVSLMTAVVLATAYAVVLIFLVPRPSLQPFWGAHWNLRHIFDFAIEPIRVELWRAAWDGFLRRPVLGWGPGGYELALDAIFRPSFHALGVQDKAHNVPLGVLCETGVIGALGFLATWATFVVGTIRKTKQGALTPLEGAALLGAGASYFVQSLFAPDATATDVTITVVFAAVASARASANTAAEERPATSRGSRFVAVGLVSAAVLPMLLFGSVLPFVASWYAKRAVDTFQDRDSAATVALLEHAHGCPSPYLDDRFTAAAAITQGLAQAEALAAWPRQKALIDVTMALTDAYLRRNPTHARLRPYVADTLLAVGQVTDPTKLNDRAESLYLQSIAESPNRQSHRFAYAGFLIRLGRIREAEEQYRQALAADPRVGQARWLLGTFLWSRLKQTDEATRLMADSLEGEERDRYVPASPLEWVQVAQALRWQQRASKLRTLADLLGQPGIMPEGPLSASACLEIAKMMEDAGLLTERDQLLRLGISRNSTLATTAGPVLAGTARLRPLGPSSSTAP